MYTFSSVSRERIVPTSFAMIFDRVSSVQQIMPIIIVSLYFYPFGYFCIFKRACSSTVKIDVSHLELELTNEKVELRLFYRPEIHSLKRNNRE
jgi:hypothetical protein